MLRLLALSRKPYLAQTCNCAGAVLRLSRMTMKQDWQDAVGRGWAAMWRKTDRAFGALTQRLLGAVEQTPGDTVLDIGCGAGELSLALAGTRKRVIGLDVSADLIATATERGRGIANLSFELGDAAAWSRPGFTPDLLVSRHGVMFFDDPPGAFAHLSRIVAPGARLVFSCFRGAAENPWASDIARMLGEPPTADPHAAGPFAFADPDHVRNVLAGWTDVRLEPVDFAYVVGEGDDPVGDAEAFLARIGPAARALRELDESARAELAQELRAWLVANRDGSRVSFPAAAWIVRANRAD